MADRSEYTSKSTRKTYKYDAPAPPKRRSTADSLLDSVNETTDTVGKGIVWGAKQTDKTLDYIVDGTVDLWKDAKSLGKGWFSSSSNTPTSRPTRRHHKSESSRLNSSTARGPTDYRYDGTEEPWEPAESASYSPPRRLTYGEGGGGSSNGGEMVRYDASKGGTVSRRY